MMEAVMAAAATAAATVAQVMAAETAVAETAAAMGVTTVAVAKVEALVVGPGRLLSCTLFCFASMRCATWLIMTALSVLVCDSVYISAPAKNNVAPAIEARN